MFCVRFGKWTPFLLFQVRLHRIRGRTLRTETLDRSDARNVKRSAYGSGSGRRFCFFKFNYTGYETSRLKIKLLKALQYRIKKGTHSVCEFLFQFNCSRKIPYMVFLLIDFHASNNLFYIENMGNTSFLL